MGCFIMCLLSRTHVYTLNEHISIEMYVPQTHIQSCWLDITPRADLASLSVYPGLPLAPSPMGCFPLGLLSRTYAFTLIEHISIDMYAPQTHIQSC
jgi:hypothetical protein